MNRSPRLTRPPFWRDSRFWIDNAHAILALVTYLLLLLSRLIDTTLLGRDSEYLGVILLQMMIFLIPGLLFCKLRGTSFTGRLRLTLPRPSQLLLMLSAAVTLLAGTLLISIFTGGMATLEQEFTLYDTFAAGSGNRFSDIAYLVLAYALLPAVCEEFVYRGILCATLEERGLVPAIAFSALSFGMLHFQFSHLPVYIFAGLVLCAVMYATGSLPAAMIVHLCYNLFGLFGQPALTRFYLSTGSSELFQFLLTVIALLGAILFCGEAGRLYRARARAGEAAPYRVMVPRVEVPGRVVRVVFCPVGLICVVCYLIACLI